MSADDGDTPDAKRGAGHDLLRLERVAGPASRAWPLRGRRWGRAVDDRRQILDPGLAPAAARAGGRPRWRPAWQVGAFGPREPRAAVLD